ncbi:helix-turn-helix domain-containing protein [Coleofasciculus sp.]|uniref:helix-turn-helix domain-containing protein n=1 Tax=Coleofasciculus sp. TaxID=3100458 RepID=UPI0039F8E7B2
MANPQALAKLEQTAIHKESFYRLRAEVGLRIANLNLSATALKLWIYLCSLFPFGDRESQMPTQGELALRLGVSRRTIIRASLELKDAALWDFRVQRWKGKNLTGYCSTPIPKPNDAGSDTNVRGCDMDVTGNDTDVRGCDIDVTGSDTDGTSHIYKDRAGAETIKTKKTDQTFSDGERERTVKEVKDPESEKAKQVKAQPTCSLPNPAQKSVNSEEKFSAAAAVVFEIPAEKKRGFYDALRQYAADSGVSRPSAYAKVTMSNLEQTGMCSLWDDFEAGLELGTSDRPTHEWLDPKSGKPYPFLVRAVEETVRNDPRFNDPVAAATQAAKIISNPKLCQPIWASVKRELLRYSKEAERMQRLGVRHTYLPPRYSDKPLEPALSEVKDAIASITPGVIKSGEKSEATLPPAVKKREKSETLPDPWEQNPLEVIEQRERKAEEALEKARNEAQRQLKASQMEQTLEQIKATLPTDQQKRQAQLQGWMNGEYPYPAIAKRLIEANQNWGLYLDGTRVLEEEF